MMDWRMLGADKVRDFIQLLYALHSSGSLAVQMAFSLAW